jgi:hypothetical protein
MLRSSSSASCRTSCASPPAGSMALPPLGRGIVGSSKFSSIRGCALPPRSERARRATSERRRRWRPRGMFAPPRGRPPLPQNPAASRCRGPPPGIHACPWPRVRPAARREETPFAQLLGGQEGAHRVACDSVFSFLSFFRFGVCLAILHLLLFQSLQNVLPPVAIPLKVF